MSNRSRALIVEDETALRKLGANSLEHTHDADARRKPSVVSTEPPVSLAELNAKLAELSTVLPVSKSALDVYEMTRSQDWDLSQIAAAIQRDASLSADVLRRANSAFYNRSGRQIVGLDEAVLRIGAKRVGELALAANALAALTPNMVPWMDLELAWRRSMAAGIAVESLIDVGGHQATDQGLLLSAIMYPLGRIALGMLFPKHYRSMVERCRQTGESLQEQERRLFPTSHTEIIAQVLASWRIPSEVFLPLKSSFGDFASLAELPEPTRTKAELVKLAILFGRLAAARWEDWDLVQVPAPGVLSRLRIRDVAQIVQQTRSDLSKLAAFHPGRATAVQRNIEPSVQRGVAYCNPSGVEFDVLAELLPSLGIQPKALAVDEVQRLDEPSIVNCLGVSPDGFASTGNWSNALFVTDQEHREAFARCGQTFALPDSYARFGEAVGFSTT